MYHHLVKTENERHTGYLSQLIKYFEKYANILLWKENYTMYIDVIDCKTIF